MRRVSLAVLTLVICAAGGAAPARPQAPTVTVLSASQLLTGAGVGITDANGNLPKPPFSGLAVTQSELAVVASDLKSTGPSDGVSLAALADNLHADGVIPGPSAAAPGDMERFLAAWLTGAQTEP